MSGDKIKEDIINTVLYNSFYDMVAYGFCKFTEMLDDVSDGEHLNFLDWTYNTAFTEDLYLLQFVDQFKSKFKASAGRSQQYTQTEQIAPKTPNGNTIFKNSVSPAIGSAFDVMSRALTQMHGMLNTMSHFALMFNVDEMVERVIGKDFKDSKGYRSGPNTVVEVHNAMCTAVLEAFAIEVGYFQLLFEKLANTCVNKTTYNDGYISATVSVASGNYTESGLVGKVYDEIEEWYRITSSDPKYRSPNLLNRILQKYSEENFKWLKWTPYQLRG